MFSKRRASPNRHRSNQALQASSIAGIALIAWALATNLRFKSSGATLQHRPPPATAGASSLKRVFSRRSDEGEQAAFPRQGTRPAETFVEAVHLIHKPDGAAASGQLWAFRLLRGLAMSRRRQHRADRDELLSNASAIRRAIVVLPTPAGPRGCSYAVRPGSEGQAQRHALSQHMPLAIDSRLRVCDRRRSARADEEWRKMRS